MAELVRGSPPMIDVEPEVARSLFEVALREIEAGRIELIRPWMAENTLAAPLAAPAIEEGGDE